MPKKQYLVTVDFRIRKAVGTFEVETNDEEAIQKASGQIEKIKKDLETVLDIWDEVEIHNFFTGLCPEPVKILYGR